MSRFARLLLCLFVFLAPSAFAQTGLYSHGTFDSRGFDSVNVGNLNVHFELPIVNKPGRGIPFSYKMVYDGLIWNATSSGSVSTWTPDAFWGFHGQLGEGFAGYITYATSNFPGQNCPPTDDGQRGTGFSQFNYTYHDSFGVEHLFDWNVAYCDATGETTINGTGASSDGNYTFNGDSVHTLSGSTINVPSYVATSSSAAITDIHGNTVTDNGNGTFTDTTGTTALTIAGGASAASPVTFTYPVVNQSNSATSATATIYYKTYTVQTNFGCNIGEYGPTSIDLVDHISLATGDTYQFTYEATPGYSGNVTGRLASVTLPTGGTTSYTYLAGCSGAGINPDGTVGSLNRVTSDSTNPRQYNRSGVSSNATITTVVDEKLNQTVYAFSFDPTTNRPYETHKQVYQGSVSGTPLREVNTCYNITQQSCDGAALNLPITSTWVTDKYNGGSAVLTENTYDPTGTFITQANIVSDTFQATTSTSYNSYGEPLSITASDGSGNMVSKVTYGYDETTPIATSGLPQHTSVSGATGNLTSTHVYYSGSGTIDTYQTNYDSGMPATVTLPATGMSATYFPTTYGYDSTGTFLTSTTLPNPGNGASLISSATYDVASGALLTSTGVNAGQITTINTYDALLRALDTTLPNGGHVKARLSNPINPYRSQDVNTSTGEVTGLSILLDGYGRFVRSALYNGQSPNPWYENDACYDAAGLLQFQPTSYQVSGFSGNTRCSGSGTGYTYDGLGRVLTIATDDGTATKQYNSRAVKTTDVNGVQRIVQHDVLGRISGICEISSNSLAGESPTDCGMDIPGTGYITTYSYDLANHKTTITQGSRTRVFQTDAAGRTVMAIEPERGETDYAYSYNSAGLQVQRTRSRANQNDPTVKTITTSQSDGLGRVSSISYNDGLTPTKHFYYDGAISAGWSQGPSGTTGLLSGTSTDSATQPTASEISYNLMGQVSSIQQCAPSICNTGNQNSRPALAFGYDLAGNLTSAFDGASGMIQYGRSPAGEVTGISNLSYQDQTNPATLVSNVVNSPFGPTSYTLGNGVGQVKQYDSLGRDYWDQTCSPTSTACGTGSQQLYGWLFSFKGNRTISISDTVMNEGQTNGYDEFNRLTSVTDNTSYSNDGGSYTYSYDRYGNRLNQAPVNGTSGPSPTFSYNANNQPNGLPYDAAGNMMSDGLGNSYTYDAEGNVLASNGSTYVYDALNHRVAATIGGTQYEYLFDHIGMRRSTWLVQYNFGMEGRIYWDGKQVAYRAFNGQTYFEHQNALGTARIRTNYQGQTAWITQSLAFGEKLSQVTTDPNGDGEDNNGYTSQEQDADNTVHFQFRQYSSTLGHWMSPDPYDGSYNLWSPQSLNRYSYALNSPLSLRDADGLDIAGCTVDYSSGTCTVDSGPLPPPAADCDNLSDCFDFPVLGSVGGGGGGGGGAPSSPAQPAPNNQQQIRQQCLDQFNSSAAGKAINFLSPVSFLLGPERLSSFLETYGGGSAKFVAATSAIAAKNSSVTTLFGSASIASPLNTLAGTLAEVTEHVVKAVGAESAIYSTGLQVLAHAGCDSVSRQQTGQTSSTPGMYSVNF